MAYHAVIETWFGGERAGETFEARWETALSPSDWTAAWLSAEDATDQADYDAGLPVVRAPRPTDGKRRFRLDFTADRASEVMITIAPEGRLVSVSLDGAAFDLPVRHPNAWGDAPALRVARPVEAGSHTLLVDVAAVSDASETVGLGGQVRSTAADGQVTRIVSGWRTQAQNGPWSTPALVSPAPRAPWPPAPARQLRHEFEIDEPVSRARLRVAAIGAYDARLNGEAASGDRLAGEAVDFSKRVLYRTHDVTEHLVRGANVLALTIGDGWFASYMAPDNRYPFGFGPRLASAQLDVTYRSGRVVRIQTDPSWRAAGSPITASEIYDGETYDARLETPGWDKAGYDDAGWAPAAVSPAPKAALFPQSSAPIRATETLRPQNLSNPSPDVRVVDFGQNFSGWARVRLRAPAGAVVTLRFAEMLGQDGHVDQRNLRGARASDRYVARGGAAETFEPLFTYHGFRYVQVEGLTDGIVLEAIEGRVAGTDLPVTGQIKTGSALVDQIWRNSVWSQRSNFVGIPTDCPQRDERLGWTGDARVYWDAAAYNMDTYAFTRRFMNDLRDAQRADGSFPPWAPMAVHTATTPLVQGAMPGWADGGVTLPWIAAQRSGDPTIIHENWTALRRFTDHVLDANPDGLWIKGRGLNLGDWLSVDATNPYDVTTPKDLLATALLVRFLDQMADMGDWSGRAGEGASYRAQAARSREAFQQYIAADGVVGNGSHTSYALALAHDLVPEAKKAAVGRKFVEDVRRRGTMLSCGFVGTPIALDALAQVAEPALIYDLLLRTEYPSWGYMIAKGATTMWERWNSDAGDVSMNSLNHYAFGAVTGFLYRRIVGIETAAPGFARLRMRPLVDPRVGYARGTYDSVRGRIEAEWRLEGDRLSYDIRLPTNTTAEVHLPAMAGASVRLGRRRLDDQDARVGRRDAAGVVLDLGPGRHQIRIG
ncbi:family 78 glycoside hydrolase catalytic domain [Brevundimonas intermedia]|uniref:family 78 glycoside hydrolase catalytic domain n=1 Tax=Brevundimonas intermedia TaxID=74315 RepID=UPI00320B36BD